MKRKDKHINKFLRDPLPDPEIPADDAWAGMSDMLDAAEDHGATGEGRLSRIWKSMGKFKGLLIGVLMVLTSAAVLLIILNAETKDQKSIEIQPVSSKIQDSALAKTDVKTPVSRPDTNHFNIATAPSETTSPKAAGAPGPITSTDPVISENRRIEAESKHSPTVAANSGRTRTRTARAGITGIRNTNTPASALAKGRGTYFPALLTDKMKQPPRQTHWAPDMLRKKQSHLSALKRIAMRQRHERRSTTSNRSPATLKVGIMI
jgi:hypothetical protein